MGAIFSTIVTYLNLLCKSQLHFVYSHVNLLFFYLFFFTTIISWKYCLMEVVTENVCFLRNCPAFHEIILFYLKIDIIVSNFLLPNKTFICKDHMQNFLENIMPLNFHKERYQINKQGLWWQWRSPLNHNEFPLENYFWVQIGYIFRSVQYSVEKRKKPHTSSSYDLVTDFQEAFPYFSNTKVSYFIFPHF